LVTTTSTCSASRWTTSWPADSWRLTAMLRRDRLWSAKRGLVSPTLPAPRAGSPVVAPPSPHRHPSRPERWHTRAQRRTWQSRGPGRRQGGTRQLRRRRLLPYEGYPSCSYHHRAGSLITLPVNRFVPGSTRAVTRSIHESTAQRSAPTRVWLGGLISPTSAAVCSVGVNPSSRSAPTARRYTARQDVCVPISFSALIMS